MTTAQQDPLHRQAFQTVIALAQKYADKFAAVDASNPSALSVTPAIYTDEKTRHVLNLLQVILERFASGHTVARILDAFYQIILDVINAPGGANGDVRKLCRDLGKWLDQALQWNKYAMSWNGALALEQLYDRGQTIFTSESHSQLSLHCTTLVHEIQSFIDAMLSDRSTRRLIDVINNISDALAEFGSTALSSAIHKTRRRRAELKRDAFVWLLPRLLATFRTVPVPRVEYRDRFIDVAVDGIFLTSGSVSTSLLPDHLAFENWTELRLDTTSGQPDGDNNLRTATRMHLHLDGARLSAKGFNYYLLLKGLLGYQDQGTLSIDVGSQNAVGQGVTMDVQLEMETDLQGRGEPSNLSSTEHMSVFRSTNVIVDVPGLSFTIEKSKHWLVNALLIQPLSGPVVRFFVRRIIEEQLRMGIDSLGRLLGKIRDLAQMQAAKRGQEGAPSLDHYWSAVLQSVGVPYGMDISTSEEDASTSRPDDSQPDAITITEVSLKGIVHTSLAPQDSDAPETQRLDGTVIAVGVGPQVVENDAGPYSEDLHVSQLSEVVEEIREGIEEVENITADTVRTATERMGSVKEDLSRAQRLKEARERLEKGRDGWRSGAYDF